MLGTMKIVSPLILALSLFGPWAQADDALKPSDFIRVDQDEKAARLQPAIASYQKGKVTVSLIGAIHLGDKAYYDDLNERFKKYDRVLFEMIGGEDPAVIKQEAGGEEHPLNRIYNLVGTILKLSHQKNVINYTAKNFVHADLTHAEFAKLQKERGESILSFAMEAAGNTENAKQSSTEALMKALLSGDPDKAKLLLVDALAQGDEAMAGLTGQSVIITDRNAKCLKVLASQIAKGDKNLGIFYGAAHFPDMEKSLLEQGFQKTGQEWVTAWEIPKS